MMNTKHMILMHPNGNRKTEWIDFMFNIKTNEIILYLIHRLFRDNSAPEIFVKPSNISIPSSIDWRKKGAVTGVKNQKQCGSCWAFAATGALEAQYFRKTGTLVSLSEQNLVDCTSSYGNDGCNGGYPNNAFKYIKDHGIDSEKSYPYQNRQNSCKFNPKKSAASSYGYGIIPKGNEQKMIEALATVGPLSIAIDNSHHSFKFYSSGIYNEPHCNPNKLEHAVLAVGYDKDYYIIKNSWGTRWGENGYIRIARNRNNLCGVASLASYPKV